MSALVGSDLPVEKCQLHLPPLEEIAKVYSFSFHKATIKNN